MYFHSRRQNQLQRSTDCTQKSTLCCVDRRSHVKLIIDMGIKHSKAETSKQNDTMSLWCIFHCKIHISLAWWEGKHDFHATFARTMVHLIQDTLPIPNITLYSSSFICTLYYIKPSVREFLLPVVLWKDESTSELQANKNLIVEKSKVTWNIEHIALHSTF